MVYAITEILSRAAPFSLLSADECTALSKACTVRSVPAKKVVFHEGDEGNNAYLVLSGRIAMVKSSPNGKELMVELIPVGSLFGIVALLNQGPYPLTARTQVGSDLLILSRTAIAPFLARNPVFQQGMVQVITSRLRSTQNLARALAHDHVDTRVASILLASLSEDCVLPASIAITRTELADLTGMTIETASRVMKAFERDGLLDLSQQGLVTVLNRDALVKLIEI